MEKIYGASERQDSLIKVGKGYYMYYGFGKDSEEAGHGYNYRHKFDHKPTVEEVREQVLAAIDMETRDSITGGMTYDGYKVSLSVENQLNYGMFRDMGAYPVTIKVSAADGSDVALSMDKEEYAAFYSSVQGHIKECLQECWKVKTRLDLSCYVI